MSIHSTAIIDPKAELAGDVEVGPYCVIEGHVRIASGCRLYHGVYVTGWTELGEKCELHPGVIVGHEPQDGKYGGERSYCRIGRGTILREHVTIHRGTEPESETVVGEDCFLLGGSHVAHNCTLGDRVTLINNVLLSGHVSVGDGATLGGAAAVHQFVRIGDLTMIPGHARISKDAVPFALMDVNGRIAGLNRVGLRRAGLDREQVREIREAYRMLFAVGVSLSQAGEQLARAAPSATCEPLLRFILGESRRGIAGRARARVRSELI